jgi:hypothetical protein
MFTSFVGSTGENILLYDAAQAAFSSVSLSAGAQAQSRPFSRDGHVP